MRADRIVNLLLLLQTQGKMTAAALADTLEVSRRTILRDVEALSLAGIPVYSEGGHGGGIGLDAAYRTSLTGLREDEIRTLFIASSSQLLDQIGLGGAVERTQRKLSAALPLRHQALVQDVRQRLYLDPVWWWHDDQPLPYWSLLQQAIFGDRVIQVVYEHHSGKIENSRLEPYSLVAKASHWYVIAHGLNGLRNYRASRFHKIELLDETFERDPAFDLETFWRDNLERFRSSFDNYVFTLRFPESALTFVQEIAVARHTVLSEPDADGWIRVEVRFANAVMAEMLVFALSPAVEVIEPAELLDAVVQKARVIAGSDTSR